MGTASPEGVAAAHSIAEGEAAVVACVSLMDPWGVVEPVDASWLGPLEAVVPVGASLSDPLVVGVDTGEGEVPLPLEVVPTVAAGLPSLVVGDSTAGQQEASSLVEACPEGEGLDILEAPGKVLAGMEGVPCEVEVAHNQAEEVVQQDIAVLEALGADREEELATILPLV